MLYLFPELSLHTLLWFLGVHESVGSWIIECLTWQDATWVDLVLHHRYILNLKYANDYMPKVKLLVLDNGYFMTVE